jgi:tRNA pseudouridine32 synthase/23S rRNA pseudouridine746 synthase
MRSASVTADTLHGRANGSPGSRFFLMNPARTLPEARSTMSAEACPPVLFIDEFLLVVDKPAGLLSVPAGGEGRAGLPGGAHPGALGRCPHRAPARRRHLRSGAVRARRGDAAPHEPRLRAARRRQAVRGRGARASRAGRRRDRPAARGGRGPPPPPGRRSTARPARAHPLPRARSPGTRRRGQQPAGTQAGHRTRASAARTPALPRPPHPRRCAVYPAPPESAARFARMHLHATRIAFMHPHTRVPMLFDSPAPF